MSDGVVYAIRRGEARGAGMYLFGTTVFGWTSFRALATRFGSAANAGALATAQGGRVVRLRPAKRGTSEVRAMLDDLKSSQSELDRIRRRFKLHDVVAFEAGQADAERRIVTWLKLMASVIPEHPDRQALIRRVVAALKAGEHRKPEEPTP